MREVKVIPSKSDAHRAMICAALSEIQGGTDETPGCNIVCDETSKDMEATAKCLKALKEGMSSKDRSVPAVCLCGESGSTLRFLLPVAGALGMDADFMPEGRLSERPLSPMYEELQSHGCSLSPQGSVPLKIRGKLMPGEYTIPGDVSSQYITGLLLALTLLDGDSAIKVSTPLQSAPYVDLTLKVMRDFGIEVEVFGGECPKYLIPGGQRYKAPAEYTVEGDWSNAAFWLAAGALADGGIRCLGLRMDSHQGDKKIVDIMKSMGADVKVCSDSITVKKSSLSGITVDAGAIPDMVPALSLLASVAEGETRIVNAERLRIKESDRLSSISDVLKRLGADITELKDGLVIKGVKKLKGGQVNGHNDHRIVMMAAVASLVSEAPVVINGSKAVNKSYPEFFTRMKELGLDGNLIRK